MQAHKFARTRRLGTIWVNSFNQQLKHHRITYDSDIEDAFVVCNCQNNAITQCVKGKSGLYECDISTTYQAVGKCFLETVKKNLDKSNAIKKHANCTMSLQCPQG
jgi:hypothetical protein